MSNTDGINNSDGDGGKGVDPVNFVMDTGQSDLKLFQRLGETARPKAERALFQTCDNTDTGVFDCEYHPGLVGFDKWGNVKRRKVFTINSANYVRYNDDALQEEQRQKLRVTTYDDSDYEDYPPGTERHKIRKGEEYQADIPTFKGAEAARQASNSDEWCYQIWDPRNCAAKDNAAEIEAFLRGDRECNLAFHLIELMHASHYNVDVAKAKFVSGAWNASVKLTDKQQQGFESRLNGLVGQRKEFKAAADILGCSKEAVMVNYYRWKGEKRSFALYKKVKKARKKEANECCVCEDGGELIYCDVCNKAYHFGCHEPVIRAKPNSAEKWYCSGCQVSSPARIRRVASFGISHGSTPTGSLASARRVVDKPTQPLISTQVRRNVIAKPTIASLPEQAAHRLRDLTTERALKLKSVHKELFSKNPKGEREQPCIPGGVVWNEALHIWQVTQATPTRKVVDDSNFDDSDDEGVSSSPSKNILRVGGNGEGDMMSESDEGTVKSSDDEKGSSSGSSRTDGEYVVSDGDEDDDEEEDFETSQENTASGQKPVVAYRSKTFKLTEFPDALGYNAFIPFDEQHGLQFLVGCTDDGQVFFNKYTQRGGKIGLAERANVFLSKTDRIVAVDGVMCVDFDSSSIVQLLKAKPTKSTIKVITLVHKQAHAGDAAEHSSSKSSKQHGKSVQDSQAWNGVAQSDAKNRKRKNDTADRDRAKPRTNSAAGQKVEADQRDPKTDLAKTACASNTNQVVGVTEHVPPAKPGCGGPPPALTQGLQSPRVDIHLTVVDPQIGGDVRSHYTSPPPTQYHAPQYHAPQYGVPPHQVMRSSPMSPPLVSNMGFRRLDVHLLSGEMLKFWADFGGPTSGDVRSFLLGCGFTTVRTVLQGDPSYVASRLLSHACPSFEKARDFVAVIRVRLEAWVQECM